MTANGLWKWDQGRLEYFQFDSIRDIAQFVCAHDFKSAGPEVLRQATGLQFQAPATHSPWRNYARTLKLALLICEKGGVAVATPVAQLLARAGEVTSDEYFHFLARSFTCPSPALTGWSPKASLRYPLLFALRYLLTKARVEGSTNPLTTKAALVEVMGAYTSSGFIGDESDVDYCKLIRKAAQNHEFGRKLPERQLRPPRESLKVISQISYLHFQSQQLLVSLDGRDAESMFNSLTPIGGLGGRSEDSNQEIWRVAELFGGYLTEARDEDEFEYPYSRSGEVADSGFEEGGRVERSHITVERNTSLRRKYFQQKDVTECDVCRLKTADTYPWTERVLDLHHLLPLSSGTQVDVNGTTFKDLVPVCPTCHRAVHRYYSNWLSINCRKDFANRSEAVSVYARMKEEFPGIQV